MKVAQIRRYLLRVTVACAAIFLLGAAMIAWSGLHDEIAHADIALVLGSKVEANGDPSPRLRARLDKTVELYRAGYYPSVIASGGIGKEGFDEAAVMKSYLVAHGLPEDHVIPDNSGINTSASAQKTAQILHEKKLGSVMVISQYFHIPRAKLALEACGVGTIYHAHANFFEIRDIYSLLRELPAWVSYDLRLVGYKD